MWKIVINKSQPGDFNLKPETRRPEQWTVDPFWDVDRPQAPANAEDRPRPSTTNNPTAQQSIPMEEGEIDSESDNTRPNSKSPQSIGQSTQALKASNIQKWDMPLEPTQKSRTIGISETR